MFCHKKFAIVQLCVAVMLPVILGTATPIEDIVSLERTKTSHVGENISLICSFESVDATVTAWFKQIPGEKPLRIVSAFRLMEVQYHNGFDYRGRFNALRESSRFTLNIANAEPSDSAIYYCTVASYSDAGLGACTVLILADQHSVVQSPISIPVQLGGNTTLQCSVLTSRCSEDHSVYWFRQGSGESHPEIIYTHGNSRDQCNKISETDSLTQSCVHQLHKNNLNLSDGGTYYCAVAACGHIIFGNGTNLDFTENSILDLTVIVLAASNIISLVVILFLCKNQCNRKHKDTAEGHTVHVNQTGDPDDVNYAALSITQTSFSRRSRVKDNRDTTETVVYSQVNHQYNQIQC